MWPRSGDRHGESPSPPYRSEWPEDIPSVDEFERPDLSGETVTDEDRASWHLYHSVMDHGDFSRYIIPPRGVEKISRSPLHQDQPVLPTPPKERYGSFVQSLDSAEREVWERYVRIRDATSPLMQLLASIRESREGAVHDRPPSNTQRKTQSEPNMICARFFPARSGKNSRASYCPTLMET